MGEVELSLLRPVSPEALIDEEAFADDEFLPYWAELWPAATALAAALPDVAGLRVVELGCGLGVPSLVAAARGADVIATDWASEAVELLRANAERNGVALRCEVRDWRDAVGGALRPRAGSRRPVRAEKRRAARSAPARARAARTRRPRRPSVRGRVPACGLRRDRSSSPSASWTSGSSSRERERRNAARTTPANPTTRMTPSAPLGTRSSKSTTPATIGSAFVSSVAVPAVSSAPARWNPSWSATKAPPCAASTAGTTPSHQPPATAAFVATSPAA